MITSDDGYSLILEAVHVDNLLAGYLEGAPDKSKKIEIVERLIQRSFGTGRKTLLVNQPGSEDYVAVIANVTSSAMPNSRSPDTASTSISEVADGSMLIVVVFFDEMNPAMAYETLVDELESTEWAKSADDYFW